VPNQPLLEVLRRLQSTGFRDLAGARVSALVPVSERLIYEVVAASLPRDGPVREVEVRPLSGDAFAVRVAPRSAFLPSLTLRLEIDRQPELPSSSVLVLRLAAMGGLLGLAGAALPVGKLLPPGVRLEGNRILVDLRMLAADRGGGDLIGYVAGLRVNTEDGRVVLNIDLAVGS
jgi:hypothetical protein